MSEVIEIIPGKEWRNSGGSTITITGTRSGRVFYSFVEHGKVKDGSARLDMFRKCFKPVTQ